MFDVNGCTGSDEIIVDVDRNRNVFIPNVFSPNQDGTNDEFQVFLGPGVRKINYIQVYDRWGGLHFNVKDIPASAAPLTGWNGISANGKKMNVGVYVYLVEVEFVDDKILLYRGDVTLIR